ncbi:MAG: hypothetical protein GXO87_00360 [Chlorobi bacterium]|nr:hypothetical protein [Chlorobiota bacterium]
MKTTVKHILLFLIIVIPETLLSQFLRIDKPLTIENGLSQNLIYTILQDQKGFIWFGTNDGLNRYDGYEFKVFKNDIRNGNSLSGNVVKSLIEDKNNILWIGTGRGLSKYNLRTDKFEQNALPVKLKETLKNKHVISLFIDDTLLWIGTRKGIYSLSLQSNRFVDYSKTELPLKDIADNYITCIKKDSKNNFWICTRNTGLFQYNASKQKLKRIKYPTEEYLFTTDVIEIAPDKMLVSTYGSGLFVVNQNTLEVFQLDPQKLGYSSFVSGIKRLPNGKILTFGQGGVFEYDLESNGASKIWTSEKNGRPNCVIIDDSGVLWIGTDGNGIFKMVPKIKNFRTVTRKALRNSNFTVESIRAIFIDKSNRLWIGGHKGISVADFNSGEISNWKQIRLFSGSPVYAIIQDPIKEDMFWIGTEGRGLYKYNVKTGKRKDVREIFNFVKPFTEVYKFLLSSDRKLYIATDLNLLVYDPLTDRFDEYFYKENSNGIVNRKYKALFEDGKGRIWIGSDRDGISIFDPAKKTFANLRADGKSNSLSADRVNVFCEDNNGNVWVGTENGLNKYPPRENGFKVFTASDGLANDYIYGILKDDEGNLWLSDNRGLTKFNPLTNKIINFDESYGLQSNEFNTVAYYKAPDGTMFFGGIKGFTYFRPSEIKLSSFKPDLLLTSFKKNNKTFPLAQSLGYANELELSYKDRIFSFGFASSDFTDPERVKYRYKLEGFGEEWIYAGAHDRSAQFTNIDPGDYTLIINASNSDGIWSPKETSLKITIIPAFWDTWLFKISAGIILFGIIFSLFHSRVSRLKKEKTIQRGLTNKLINSQEEERKSISSELHDDLGQNLLVVKNKLMLSKRDDSFKENFSDVVKIIDETIKKISNISHLLHPSELEQLGLTKAIEAMAERISFSSELKITNNLFSLDKYFREDEKINIFRIFQEALNNVLKHSEANKVILKSDIKNGELILSIIDDGIGFDKSVLFNQVDRPRMGIKGMEERVNMLGGSFAIESQPEKGTAIKMKFQVTAENL